MNNNQKDIDGITECIQEAERYIARCKKLKADYEYPGAKPTYYPNINHSAVLRAGIDLRRVIAKFVRRAKDTNYNKPWSEVD